MADIFISYSSKDRAQAEQLMGVLTTAGLSSWIDRSGIDVATTWSKEIVQAIDACKAFVVLLSQNSVLSDNVAKEVSIAAEQKKKILPIDLERIGDDPVELSEELRYHLAGIQRAPMTNIDAIMRALGKLGLEPSSAPHLALVEESEARKSLMILPFEDLSPTGDNGWFADGIVSEMISALSNVKALRVIDAATSKEYKSFKGHLMTYAREMKIRYFVQGDVRKFGDNIKITSRLLDIETGDHLWQDSMKGTMDDIFDIQEKVAGNVVQGMQVYLADGEKGKLAERGTANAEAYELYMRAGEYFARQTKEGFQFAIQLLTESLRLDADFAQAYLSKASTLAFMYRLYDRNSELLDEAEVLCKEALRLKPGLFVVYYPLSVIYLHRGQIAEAERMANEFVRQDPMNYYSHFVLGIFYAATGQPARAIAAYEEAVRIQPESLASLWNLVSICDAAGDLKKCARWASVVLPYVQRNLKLHPDDEGLRVQQALLLLWIGNTEDARAATMKLTNLREPSSLYNMACLLMRLNEGPEALRAFCKAIKSGYRDIRQLNEFLSDENSGVLLFMNSLEYQEAKQMVKNIERETALGKTSG